MNTPCAKDLNLWTSENAGERAYAASLCVGCDELTACGLGAMQRGERFGVWGGKDLTQTKRGGPADLTHCANPACGKPITQNAEGGRRRYCNDTCSSHARRKPIKHGTLGGWRMHSRRGVPMCDPCSKAGNLARAESRERRRAAA